MRSRLMRASALAALIVVAPAHAGVYFNGVLKQWPITDRFNDSWELIGTMPFQFLPLLEAEKKQYDLDELEKKPPAALSSSERVWIARAKLPAKLKVLDEKKKAGKLTTEDVLWLSAYCLYNPEQMSSAAALRETMLMLEKARRDNPKHFQILANLASVYHRLAKLETMNPQRRGDYWSEAKRNQQKVLDNWPAKHQDWNKERLQWTRRVESQYLKHLQLRSRQKPGGRARDEDVDALFGDIDWEPGGEYQIGKLDWQKSLLPRDDLRIVALMLAWQPHDNRLRWLFAELLNTRGDLEDAFKVMNDLRRSRKYHQPVKLKRHHAALAAAIQEGKGQRKVALPPQLKNQGNNQPAIKKEDGPAPASKRNKNDVYAWGFTGLGVGIAFGILIMLQVREIQRRMARARERVSDVSIGAANVTPARQDDRITTATSTAHRGAIKGQDDDKDNSHR